jgi:hypothetical protein
MTELEETVLWYYQINAKTKPNELSYPWSAR